VTAQAIIFLHGNLSRGAHWAPQTRALQAEGFRCFAPDQRGFGSPPASGLPSSIVELADDVASLCAAEGVKRACVVGLSMGGVVAQAVATRHPGLVHSLLLAGTYRADELHPTIAAFNARVSEGVPPIEVMAPMMRASFSERYQAAHPEVVERFVAEMLATRQASLEATVKALGDFPAVRAPEIKAKTVVIGGSLDGLCPAEASRHLAQAIPGARYVELETGHLSNIEAPDEFTEQVRLLAAR
jgi:pimeloyl-ACP methyl ester carboxylesterase